MTPVIYKIEFPDGQFYIGSSCNFSARRQTHLSAKRKKNAVNAKLQMAFDTHRICGIYIIASGFSRDTLHLLEQQIMDAENPPLNIAKATPIPKSTDGAVKSFGPHVSVAEFARHSGISYRQAKYVVKNKSYAAYVAGLSEPPKSKQKGCTHPPDPRKQARCFFHNGAWYDSAALRKISGVSEKAYRRRITNKMCRYRACTEPMFSRKKQKRSEFRVLCEANNIGYGIAYQRVRCGWSKLEAATIPVGAIRTPYEERNVKRRYITANGLTLSLDQWASKLGIKKSILSGRLNLGWSESQAVGAELPPNHYKAVAAQKAKESAKTKRIARLLTYKGVTDTVSSLCRQFGVNDPVVRGRLKLGWSIEEAFEGRPNRTQRCLMRRAGNSVMHTMR